MFPKNHTEMHRRTGLQKPRPDRGSLIEAFGYDCHKQVVSVELSADEIIAAGIHPWRVDLFDPNPIKLTVGEIELSFSRLTDIAFGYGSMPPNKGVIVALADGSALSVEGPTCEHTSWKMVVEMSDIRALSDAQWTECFRRYLVGSDVTALWSTPTSHLLINKQRVAYAPLEPFVTHVSEGFFAGEMFEPVRMLVDLPECMRWVFDAFPGLHPVVAGGAVRALVTGEEQEPIQVLLDRPDVHDPDYAACLSAAGVTASENESCRGLYHPQSDSAVCFERDGLRYRLHRRRSGRPAIHARIGDRHQPFWPDSELSINQFVVSSPDFVVASRIAIHDIGTGQMRCATQSDRDLSMLDAALHNRYRFVETPFDPRFSKNEDEIEWRWRVAGASGQQPEVAPPNSVSRKED